MTDRPSLADEFADAKIDRWVADCPDPLCSG
jgi:hypothetical protein